MGRVWEDGSIVKSRDSCQREQGIEPSSGRSGVIESNVADENLTISPESQTTGSVQIRLFPVDEKRAPKTFWRKQFRARTNFLKATIFQKY